MVFLFFLVAAVAAIDMICDAVAGILYRVNVPRIRWNRGGRYRFN